MQVKIFCPRWGREHQPWPAFLADVKAAGFDGVDTWLPTNKEDRERFPDLLAEFELDWVAHQHEADGTSFDEFNASFEHNLRTLAALQPYRINSHTGRDWFSFEQNAALLETGSRVEEETGILLLHETHRGRFSFSPAATLAYLERLPDLRLTADLSHWCCVTESLLENFSDQVALAIERADHAHARVGYAQGPQVPDPRAPEWRAELDAHLSWWDAMVAHKRTQPRSTFAFTTEFGPPPYQATLPFKGTPVADPWEINAYMLGLLRERYG